MPPDEYAGHKNINEDSLGCYLPFPRPWEEGRGKITETECRAKRTSLNQLNPPAALIRGIHPGQVTETPQVSQ